MELSLLGVVCLHVHSSPSANSYCLRLFFQVLNTTHAFMTDSTQIFAKIQCLVIDVGAKGSNRSSGVRPFKSIFNSATVIPYSKVQCILVDKAKQNQEWIGKR
jgi:hypothetical protein